MHQLLNSIVGQRYDTLFHDSLTILENICERNQTFSREPQKPMLALKVCWCEILEILIGVLVPDWVCCTAMTDVIDVSSFKKPCGKVYTDALCHIFLESQPGKSRRISNRFFKRIVLLVTTIA